jgi:CHAT domain-containing protein
MAEQIRLRVPGKLTQPDVAESDLKLLPFLKATITTEVDVAFASRGAAAGIEPVEYRADPHASVVELEFEGGIRQYVNPAQLRDDLWKRNQVSRSADLGDAVSIPTDFGGADSRGKGDLVLKALRLFGVDPAGAVADQAVRLVVSSFEDKLDPAPGLYRLRDPEAPLALISDTKELDGDSPYLLFLHGTASSISGSFGGLAPGFSSESATNWAGLAQRYGTRILALQHKTFSESPVKNALDVAKLLPEGARLHLVSHSRGGLIGELLCMTDLQDWHFQAFENAAKDRLDDAPKRARPEILEQRQREVENIRRLAEVIRAKRFTVEKFVRVACPARGTILLSKRLDLYLSVLLNVIGLIPTLKASIVYTFLKACVLETARRRTDPRELPGIEAMMPESPLVHILNQPALRSTADLAVISGDLDPEGIWKKLALLAVQVLYLQDNDLVVNTKAMYGGMQRVKKASYFFNQGPHVNHFHYFQNPGTRGRLCDWLTSGAGARVEGFEEFVPQQKEFKADTRRALGDKDTRPVLFLLPDLLGSRLSDKDVPVWISAAELSRRGLESLASNELTPSGLVPELYADLHNALSNTYRVEAFAYDWRKSLLEARDKLEAEVRKCLEGNCRVVMLGHGTGGTLGLLLAQNKELWLKFTAQGGRLVMLGSPIHVSGFACTLVLGAGRLNRLLNIVSPCNGVRAAEVFRRFSGVLEFADPSLLSKGENAQVTALRKQLRFSSPPQNVAYVAGEAPRTAAISQDRKEIGTTSAGDGHVTWAEARAIRREREPEGESVRPVDLPAWLLAVPHGNLASAISVLPAILDLLSRGDTDRLPKLPGAPVVQDGVLATEDPVLYPEDSDLADAAFGRETKVAFREPQLPLRAWVSNGHLRQAEYPLVVGHYQDDTIVSAEKVLDRCLGGRLTERFAMSIYPGPERTAEIVRTPGAHPPGAIVVGLGEVGELTQEKVRRGVTSALLRYVLATRERGETTRAEPPEIGVSTLLVGGYAELTIRESVAAIVNGILEANRQLRTHTPDHPPRVSSVEFIDLYEDVAIDAAHELINLGERLNGDSTSGQVLAADQFVHTKEGGQTSRPLNPYQSGWWRRVSITDENGSLHFTILTDRARVPEVVQGTQRRLVERFVSDAVTTTAYNRELSSTLFQLLVPRTLQAMTADKINAVLVVDRESAKYPWELLAQRSRSDVEPLVTQFGLVRQFRSVSGESRMSPASGMAALVIGDTASGYQPLLGAQKEALAVATLLKDSYEVNPLKPDVSGEQLVSALVSREYRILHLAAHGEFNPGEPHRSGVVLGKNLWLTPNELRGMLAAPDLAFINCCYLGGIETARQGTGGSGVAGPELASNFAETLMNLGTRAVVVAGWAVDDAAGKAFAERFYDRMLKGDTFGDSIRDARKYTYELHGGKNTWGAYQCYGNPDFRLKQREADLGGLGENKKCYVSRLEILQRLQDMAAVAQEIPDKGKVTAQLEQLRVLTPVDWRDGEVLGAFGKNYESLRDNAQAIACYQQALADETSKARLKLVQDLGNLMERAARRKQGEARARERERAIKLLLDLGTIIDTGEQNSLLGGYYKRMGRDADNEKERRSAYEMAMKYYEKAYQKRKEIGHEELYYPGINAAALAFVLRGRDGAAAKAGTEARKWKGVLSECVQSAKEKNKRSPDFWSRVSGADALLVQRLWEKSLANRADDAIAAYQDVIEGGGRPNEFDSMLDQIRFLAAASKGPEKAALENVLEDLGRRIPR